MKMVLSYIYKNFWSRPESDKFSILVAFFISLLVIALNIITPLYFKYIIDFLSKQSSLTIIPLLLFGCGYAILWSLSHILTRTRALFSNKANQRCIRLIIVDIFRGYLNKTQAKSSEVVGLLERVNTHIPELIEGILWHIIPIVIELSFAFIIVVNLTDIYIALVLSVTVIIYLIYLSQSLQRINDYQVKSALEHNNFIDKIIDSFNNLEVVKLFNGYNVEQQKILNAASKKENIVNQTNKQVEKIGTGQFLIIGIGLGILMCLMINKVVKGKMQLGDLVLVHSYLMQFTLPLAYFGFVAAGIRKGIEVINEALSIIDVSNISDKSLTLKEGPSGLHCNNLNLDLNESRILENINLLVPKGKTTGIIGLSGNGKTSLIKVISKIYNVSNEALYINGIDINRIEDDKLRSILSVAFQDNLVFNDSILENITYGSKKLDYEKLEKILQLTNLKEVINRLSEGIDTIISNEHNLLSRGEIQRINIARCLYKEASIYIFDEPTSALDVKNEQEIIENIMEYLKEKTVIIVSHKASSLKNLDRVVIMGKGVVKNVYEDIQSLSEQKMQKLLSN